MFEGTMIYSSSSCCHYKLNGSMECMYVRTWGGGRGRSTEFVSNVEYLL